MYIEVSQTLVCAYGHTHTHTFNIFLKGELRQKQCDQTGNIKHPIECKEEYLSQTQCFRPRTVSLINNK